MKSPIIYYGGKTSMLDKIIPIIPIHDVYTEIFCGGAAVLFAKPKVRNETINDKLDIVVNFYEQLKSNYKNLKKLIDLTLCSKTQFSKASFILKNKQHFTKVEIAYAFWMLCNHSHSNKIGGGLKYSNHSSTVVPLMIKRNKELFTAALVDRIEHIHIENRDAVEVLKMRDTKSSYHFIDPPYISADQGHYKGYTLNELDKLLSELENIKGKFTLCNYNSDLLNEYVKRNFWYKQQFEISNKGMRHDDRNKTEVMVCNYNPIIQCNLFST